jgi:hypothetical protein
MNARRCLLTGLFILGTGNLAQATVAIGEYNDHSFFGILGSWQEATVNTYLSPNFGAQSGEGTLFENFVVQSGVTRTDIVTFGDDPDFPRYVEIVTDGLDWYLYDQMVFSPQDSIAVFSFESVRLPLGDDWDQGGGDPPPDLMLPRTGGSPDLIGYTIEYVERTVTLTLTSPGSDPNGDGNWTDIEFEILTTIYGTPEPTTGVLAIAGALSLAGRRRRVRA